MKTPRYCSSITNKAAGLGALLIFTVACTQTAQPESTTKAAQTEVAEPIVTNSPTVSGAEAAEPTGGESAEIVELVVVDPPAGEGSKISEPVTAESVEVELPPEPAKPRYKKEDVLWIQQRLEELGYYTGNVDGTFGQVTREAIKAYQADQELVQDGLPTPELRDFMWRNGG